MIGPNKIGPDGITFTLFAHTNREYGSTLAQDCGKLQTLFPTFPHCVESRRRRRRGFPHQSSAAARKRYFVWRRGEEFERLI